MTPALVRRLTRKSLEWHIRSRPQGSRIRKTEIAIVPSCISLFRIGHPLTPSKFAVGMLIILLWCWATEPHRSTVPCKARPPLALCCDCDEARVRTGEMSQCFSFVLRAFTLRLAFIFALPGSLVEHLIALYRVPCLYNSGSPDIVNPPARSCSIFVSPFFWRHIYRSKSVVIAIRNKA